MGGKKITKHNSANLGTFFELFSQQAICLFQNYCAVLAKQIGLRGPKTASGELGISLQESQLDHFDGQQIYQLYELRQSIAPISSENKDNSLTDLGVDKNR